MEALVAVMTAMEKACQEQRLRYEKGDTTPVKEMMPLFTIHCLLQAGQGASPETVATLARTIPKARVWLAPQMAWTGAIG